MRARTARGARVGSFFHALPGDEPVRTIRRRPERGREGRRGRDRRVPQAVLRPLERGARRCGRRRPGRSAKAIDKAFGDWQAPKEAPHPRAPLIEFSSPTAPDPTHVIVANRPKSVQSDIVVSSSSPNAMPPSWPTDRVAVQVLGGGGTGRLYLDVREKRSLAYSTAATALELAHDAQPLLAFAAGVPRHRRPRMPCKG